MPQEDRTLYQALECCAQDAIGPGGSWAASMDSGLVNNLGQWHAGLRRSTGCYMHADCNPAHLSCIASNSKCAHLIYHAGKYRKYSFGSLRDLLRVIRNKHNHFR